MDLPGDEGAMPDTAPLTLTIQKAPNGVIVNSNVFLTEKHWHTLVNVDGDAVQCAVCDICCKANEYQDHINCEEHSKSLEMHLPLSKYELCIIRKIRNKYHCGVCNEIIDIKESDDHFATKLHEEKLLFAVNRVSDIMYDFDLHSERIEKEECYHFNARSINNRNYAEEDEESTEGFYDYYPDKRYDQDYANESTDEYGSDIEAEVHDEFSYASMARKPGTIPKFLEMEIGGKNFKVRFDSWHMILNPKPNSFYCMVCKIENHIRFKPDHCTDADHLARLKGCDIVEKYAGFLVRKVDHRLQHCAHCNNLQLVHEMEEHIEAQHPIKKNKNLSEGERTTPSMKRISKVVRSDSVTRTANKSTNIDTKTVDRVADYVKNTTARLDTDRIDNRVKELYIFCLKFTLSLLSYNMVSCCNGYRCLACETVDTADGISRHIGDISHIENLMRLPFMFEFNCNLIRPIRNGLHCTICNIPVAYGKINGHILDQVHVTLLNRAITLSPTTRLIKDPVENQPSTSRGTSLNPQDDTNQFSILNQVDVVENIADNDLKQNEAGHADVSDVHIVEEIAKVDAHEATKPEENKYVEVALDEAHTEKTIDEHVPLNIEEFVYLKLRNNFIKVTVTSYNTLVQNGDGTRYCCLCSKKVSFESLGKHVANRAHTENVRKYKFLDRHEKHLLRQVYLSYHCALCNVAFTRRELSTHLSWAVHLQQIDCCHKIDKKNRRAETKNGMKQINITLQNETIYLMEVEPQIKIVANIEFVSRGALKDVVKKSKIVIFNGNVLKISWDSWNGFCKAKAGYRCIPCQKDLKIYDMSVHANSILHVQKLEKTCLKQYMPALMRKINETTIHCVTCNIEVSNKDHIIGEHLKSKKHEKTYGQILQGSSQANTYSDCNEDVFTLQ